MKARKPKNMAASIQRNLRFIICKGKTKSGFEVQRYVFDRLGFNLLDITIG